VDSVGGFGKDCGEKANWDREGSGGPRKFGDGFAGFENEGGRVGAEEDLWPCGDVILPEGIETGEEGSVCFAG
jgi:CobQ-like glutamine amidotransferase family enzyme